MGNILVYEPKGTEKKFEIGGSFLCELEKKISDIKPYAAGTLEELDQVYYTIAQDRIDITLFNTANPHARGDYIEIAERLKGHAYPELDEATWIVIMLLSEHMPPTAFRKLIELKLNRAPKGISSKDLTIKEGYPYCIPIGGDSTKEVIQEKSIKLAYDRLRRL